MIKTITVTLYERTATGAVDDFNKETYTETAVEVPGVLCAPSSSQEILDGINLYGKKAIYTLAIPKGDTHSWEDCKVSFSPSGTGGQQDWHVFGIPLEGIECDIPLAWNKKVTVERYE